MMHATAYHNNNNNKRLHGVSVGEWLFLFPLCGFSLSLFCNYNNNKTKKNRASRQTQAGIGHSAPAHRGGHVQNSSRRKDHSCTILSAAPTTTCDYTEAPACVATGTLPTARTSTASSLRRDWGLHTQRGTNTYAYSGCSGLMQTSEARHPDCTVCYGSLTAA